MQIMLIAKNFWGKQLMELTIEAVFQSWKYH